MDRWCATCEMSKPLEEFVRSKAKPFGRDYICKSCARVKARRRRLLSPVAVAAARANHRARHPEAARAASRRWRAANPEKVAAINRRRPPEQHRAHQAVQKALRRGTLVRPDHCEQCGEECKPQAHHGDYARRLDVKWLCPSCHKGEDMERAA